MSEKYIKIKYCDDFRQAGENQKVFVIDTFLSLRESNCLNASLDSKTKFNIERRGAIPIEITGDREDKEGFLIATAPIFKSDESYVDQFEIAMNALKIALCNEFNQLALSMRNKLFPSAPPKELIRTELFDNYTRRKRKEEEKKFAEECEKLGKKYYTTSY